MGRILVELDLLSLVGYPVGPASTGGRQLDGGVAAGGSLVVGGGRWCLFFLLNVSSQNRFMDSTFVDAGPTGYPAREREDLVQLGFFSCNLSNRTIK